jgi:hypothetical protein
MDPEISRNLQAARRLTSGLLFVEVSWKAIAGLALRVALDRNYDLEERFGRKDIPEFFEVVDPGDWERLDVDSRETVDWLLQKDPQNAVYLELLIRLFARRLKYRRILNTQAFPTIDQVGPRMLLEHGLLDEGALSSLVVWRKWAIYMTQSSPARWAGLPTAHARAQFSGNRRNREAGLQGAVKSIA